MRTDNASKALVLPTFALSITGSLSLVISGELTTVMLMPGLAVFYGYYRLFQGKPPLDKYVIGTLSAITASMIYFDTYFITKLFLESIAHMTITFQAIKSFDLKEPWDYLQVYFMALLQLVITSELTYSPIFGLVFLVFLAIFISTIVVSHFIQEGTLGRFKLRRPLAYISGLVLLLAVVFFLVIPRVGGGLFGKKQQKGIKTVGFSGTVNFGSFGDVLEDQTIVFRADVSGRTLPLYWRGVALDSFDGVSWSETIKGRSRIAKTDNRFVIRSLTAPVTYQKIYLEPSDTEVIFGLGEIIGIDASVRYIEMDYQEGIYVPYKRNKRFEYAVYSIEGESNYPYSITKNRYLQFPEGIDRKRMIKFADSISSKEKAPLGKANLIDGYFTSRYKYNLKVKPPPAGVNPIENFLYNTKEGYCEYYATSMVLMLRSLGIPARIVTGYYGGDVNDIGNYIIVRQRNAHAWVEALIDNKWRRFDPTPLLDITDIQDAFALYTDSIRMFWYRYVVGFSSYDQRRLLDFISSPQIGDLGKSPVSIGKFSVPQYSIYIIIIALSALLIILLIRKKQKLSKETIAYLKFRTAVKKAGGDIGHDSTPDEVINSARSLGFDQEAVELIKLYEEARFGGRELDDSERRRIQRLASFHPNSPIKGTKVHGV